MVVSRKTKNMKKSSKVSKNIKRSSKNKRITKCKSVMKGGVTGLSEWAFWRTKKRKKIIKLK